MYNRTDNDILNNGDKGAKDLARSGNTPRLKRDLSHEAISLALQGEWERATEVNRAILELFAEDVDAMNRLGKALIELGRYDDAKKILNRVVLVAPYNNIAKKNIARLTHLGENPSVAKQARKGGSAPQLFIEESGKSGTTVLRNMASRQVIARVAPSDPANLVVEKNNINVYGGDDEYLGQIEPKLARRLIRLMYGGNEYDAAIVGINEHAVSIIVREIHRDPSLRGVCSFPTRLKEEHRVYLGDNLARYISEENLDDEDEPSIDEEAMDTDWADNE
ncbi:MAG: hypothetical protein BZY88_14810 [SAR202 cluster bacterium Io17-Chloro-G9]|nr:MAG: hypothetical protein BZY88_14810 [SAR202 cluster bacterium Io17-Chloro-G9]